MILPMSDLELRLVRALDRCDLKEGSTDNRFCNNLAMISMHHNKILLTDGQRNYSGALHIAIAIFLREIYQRKPRREPEHRDVNAQTCKKVAL
jgi:hypothetical protein